MTEQDDDERLKTIVDALQDRGQGKGAHWSKMETRQQNTRQPQRPGKRHQKQNAVPHSTGS